MGDILAKYSSWSGQKVNYGKSALFCSNNMHQELAAALCDFLQVKAMSIHSKYLGLPLFMGCSRKKAFEDVKAKVMSKVAGWKVRTLSQAERATLIKSVAIAMPIYCMSTFLLPNGWCAEIDRTLMDFWWGFPTQKARNCTPRAWDDICLPKELGGLGVRKMFEVNKALIAKLGWKLIFETDSLSVRTIRLKYKVRDPMVASGGGGVWGGELFLDLEGYSKNITTGFERFMCGAL